MINDTVKVDINYNLEDIQSFLKSHMHRRVSPVWLTVLSLFFIGGAIVTLVHAYGSGDFPFEGILFILFPIFYFILLPSVRKKTAKNMFDTNKLIKDTQSFRINNESITVFSLTGKSDLAWDKLYKAVETKESFLLYISSVQAYIIPKRCFAANEGQIALLRDYIKNAPLPKGDKKSLFTPKKMGIGCLAYIMIFLLILIFTIYFNK